MIRKVIGMSILAATIATVIVPVLMVLSDTASAQSGSGRTQGCFDKSGKWHHLTVGVLHDEGFLMFFDGPGRWEAAGRGHDNYRSIAASRFLLPKSVIK